MPSITTWTRLEPNAAGAAPADTLQARLYDPLWLLTRQWQLGEFQGDDAGTPLSAVLRGTCAGLTRFRPGPIPAQPVQGTPYDVRNVPLETLVERERVRPTSLSAAPERLQPAAEAGQQFLRLLAREPFGSRYHAVFIATFPLPVLSEEQRATAGQDSLRFLDIMAGRVPNGTTLAAAMRQPSLPAGLGIDPSHQPDVRHACDLFLTWYDRLFNEPSGGGNDQTWSSDRMEYAFCTAAPTSDPSAGETVLTAREYYGGTLDWYDFDLNPSASVGAAADRAAGKNPLPIARTVIPAPVSYRGMPSPRWWEFEDSAVDFGGIDTEPQDFARLLLVEFAVTYGNDWFVIPIDLPVGSLCQIQSLVVTDTFGVRTLIPSIGASTHPAASSWRMFTQSIDRIAGTALGSARRRADALFLAPTLLRTIEGKPLEEVLFLRDELANLAWGVERLVEGLSGRSVNRREAYLEAQNRTASTGQTGKQKHLTWRLATEVPDYWIPLVPVQQKAGESAIVFRRGATLRQDGSVRPQTAQSHVLLPNPTEKLDIYEEELPREGLRITRSYQYSNWIDGSHLLWIGRRKQPGRGEGSSGLQCDVAEKEGN
jgi:hypothetical protein